MIFGYRSGERQTGTNIKKKEAERGNQKIIDLLEDDDKHILIAFYPWKVSGSYWVSNPDAKPVVYKLNVYNGKKQKVGRLQLPFSSAITDNNGDVRFSVGVNKKDQVVVSYKKTAEDEWQDFSLEKFKGITVMPLSFTKDNQSVYLLARVKNGTKALYLFNLKDKSYKKLYHNPDVDISLIFRDFSEKRIVAVGTELALPEYHHLDKSDKKLKLHGKLLEAFSGSDVLITSVTKDEKYAIAYVYSDANPGDYYQFNIATLEAKYLISKRNWIYPEEMARTESITFKTRDDQSIYGYITKPKGLTSNLPMLVLPHGGPHGARDFWGYNWEVQLLANRGYVVLQVNFRGSGGFGKAFQQAGYGKWGTLMQDDLTDATQAVIKQGIADPERVCIYGSSYGGYAALMGAVREPDLYQCAIGSMGVYNLPMMFEEGDIQESEDGIAYLHRAVGKDIKDQKKRSPVYNVDKIKADILLVHGAKDERAPIEQAESLMEAFDEIGKSYEWLKIGNESHGYYDEKNRLKVYSKVLEFLDKNIGKKAKP